MKWWWTSVVLMPLFSTAQIKVAKIFSDNMVLQRNEPVRIWGKGIPGKMVSVVFANNTIATQVQNDSTWIVTFKKQKANTQPQSIIIKSDGFQKVFQNVLIGDVWLCSGQSNMEWPMSKEKHWKDEIKNTIQPLIRLNNPPPAGRYVYGVAYTDSLNKRLNREDFYLWESWQNCDSNTVKGMSAIAYYFAKQIVTKEGVPIGIINLSIGGAPIETFISKEALAISPQFSGKVKGNWLQNKNLPEWIRERGMQNVATHINGFGDELGLNHAYKPGFAFESGIRPLLQFPIKGVLWYQGESNSLEKERVDEYSDLLHVMIADYRAGWKQPHMPFYWVQLSSIDTAHYQSQYWPQFRDEQRQLLAEVKNGGMAVCSDIGFKNDVHPTNKKVVGERLARWALHKTYKQNVVPSGPLPKKAKFKRGKIVVCFHYGKGLQIANGKILQGFSVDAINDTKAYIKSNRVFIECKNKPQFLYYGWKPFTDANLVNKEMLPASTFKIPVQ